jgi:hypothetical protein
MGLFANAHIYLFGEPNVREKRAENFLDQAKRVLGGVDGSLKHHIILPALELEIYQGPEHKLAVVLDVFSTDESYSSLQVRKNIEICFSSYLDHKKIDVIRYNQSGWFKNRNEIFLDGWQPFIIVIAKLDLRRGSYDPRNDLNNIPGNRTSITYGEAVVLSKT